VTVRRTLAVFGGTVVGAVLGLVAADRLGRSFRDDLFHPRPMHRLAALGHLARNAGVDSVGLLRDYLVWEPHALLRWRATALLERLEARYAS